MRNISYIQRLWFNARKFRWIITQAVGRVKLEGFISGTSKEELIQKANNIKMRLMGLPFRYSPIGYKKIRDG